MSSSESVDWAEYLGVPEEFGDRTFGVRPQSNEEGCGDRTDLVAGSKIGTKAVGSPAGEAAATIRQGQGLFPSLSPEGQGLSAKEAWTRKLDVGLDRNRFGFRFQSDDGLREYNWKELKGGWWHCDLINYALKFQGEKGAELQLSDRRYRDVDLAVVQTRLLRSVLQHATGLKAGRLDANRSQHATGLQAGRLHAKIVASILQDSNNPAPVLEVLKFEDCGIESFRPYLDAIEARKLIGLKSLTFARISRESWRPAGLPVGQLIANVIGLGTLPNLAKFEAHGGYRIGDAPANFWWTSLVTKSFVDSLKDMGGSLRELKLSFMHIAKEGHLALAEALESGRLLHLEKLILTETSISSGAYCKSRVRLEALEELDFSDNQLVEEDHVALAAAMESSHLPRLQSLNLSNTYMEGVDCKAYAKAFLTGNAPALKNIFFSGNRIGDEGAKALSVAFASGHLDTLVLIHLASNRIEDAGMEAICKATMEGHLRDLRELYLYGNRMSKIGFSFIGSVISSGGLNSLRHLSLEKWTTREDEDFLPILAAVSETKSFIANIEGGGGDMMRQLEQLRVRNLKHVQMMEELARPTGRVGPIGQLEQLRVRNLKHVQTMEELARPTGRVGPIGPDGEVGPIGRDGEVGPAGGVGQLCQASPTGRVGQVGQASPTGRVGQASPVGPVVAVVAAKHGKIYLCGNPEAGKTTLRRTLSRSLWKSLCMWERRPHKEERTRGIAVSELKSEGKDGVSLALWDMAGQREYHMVHHSFLRDLASLDAKSTFFIIVCRSQENIMKVEDELEYWLQFIASSCRKETQTPRGVFVVLNRNHGDSILKQMNDWKGHLSKMKQKFKGYLNIYTEVQDLFVMDVRRRKSVQSLKKSLLQHSKQMLENTNVPEICHQIQVQVNVWKRKMPFPVLHWTEFLKKVQEIDPQWMEKTVEAATQCLNEEGALVYINKEFPADWQIPHARLVILDPNWVCAEVVGNIFLPEDLKKRQSRELKVNRHGAVSTEELKEFFKSTNFEWEDSDLQDVMIMLLWLGLCYKDRSGNLFIPSRIEEDTRRGKSWDGLSISLNDLHSVDQWVMGFSVEYQDSEIGLAPIALWHNFQVELAQTSEYNGGGLGNDFTVGKYFVGFNCKQMAVLIEVNVSNDNPTFRSIDLFVKPIDDQAKTTKVDQVDLAHQLVQSLCDLWGEVCPGIRHVKKVVWPWPALQPKPDFTDAKLKELCWDVSRIKVMVKDKGMGKLADARVGAKGEIAFEQLLCEQDIVDVVRSLKGELQKKVQAWNGEMEEGIKLGVFPDDILKREGFTQSTESEASTSRGFIGRENFKPIDAEELKCMSSAEQVFIRYLEYQRRLAEQVLAVAQQTQDIALDNQRMIREVYKELNQVKTQQELTLEKLQNFEQLFLENMEQSCPRFIYLVTKSSGSSVVATLKNAMSRISPTVKFHIRFLCEAPYDAAGNHGQHALADDLQEGIDVSMLEDWARKLAPWLKVSLAVLSISAKVAVNVFAPGLGSIIPNLGDIVPSTVAELIEAGTGHAMSSLDSLMHEGQGPSSVSSPSNPQELTGNSRKEMAEKLQELRVRGEFERKIGLSKVYLKQVGGSRSSVLWICANCKREYSKSNKIIEL